MNEDKNAIVDIKNMDDIELIKYWGSKKHDPKEVRRIHKELRKYGDGIPFPDRYPNLPMQVSIISLAVAIVALIIRLIPFWFL